MCTIRRCPAIISLSFLRRTAAAAAAIGVRQHVVQWVLYMEASPKIEMIICVDAGRFYYFVREAESREIGLPFSKRACHQAELTKRTHNRP